MNKQKLITYIALVIAVLAISSSAIMVKFATAPSGIIAFYRLFFTVLLMLPFFLVKYVSELKNIHRKDWLFSILAGIFLAFHFILWFESLNYTSVASSTVLVTMQPLFAFIGTYFLFKERFTFRTIICILFAIIGSVMISWGDFNISRAALFGDFLALLACLLITIYLLFGQSVRKRVSMITYTFIIYAFSSITLFIYVLIKGYSLTNYPESDWLLFILLAIVPTLLGHSIFNWLIKWVSTTTVSMAVLFEPIGAIILAYYLLDEKLIWTQIVGGSIVICSIITYLYIENKKK